MNVGFLFVGDECLFGIEVLVKCCAAAKAGRRACCANVLQNYLVAGERFASPVCADEAKHPMLD